MTTIAVKAGKMACDTMECVSSESGGDRAYYFTRKIFEIHDEDGNREYVGGAGDSHGILMWLEWYREGCENDQLRQDMLEGGEFDIVILHEDGRLEGSDHSCMIFEIEEPFYAIGSGTKCALAAMHCGRSAADAVALSMKIDPNTGGDVREYGFE